MMWGGGRLGGYFSAGACLGSPASAKPTHGDAHTRLFGRDLRYRCLINREGGGGKRHPCFSTCCPFLNITPIPSTLVWPYVLGSPSRLALHFSIHLDPWKGVEMDSSVSVPLSV